MPVFVAVVVIVWGRMVAVDEMTVALDCFGPVIIVVTLDGVVVVAVAVLWVAGLEDNADKLGGLGTFSSSF